MGLDFSSLQKALASLDRAIQRALNDTRDEELRDAVIQRFEYTYELSWKMLKRRLEADSASPSSVDAMSFRELIREGAERGLIEDVEAWMLYRSQRNLTSHVYDAEKAARVFETAVQFAGAARSLLDALQGSAT